MIIAAHGNLMTADAEALVNAVNTVGVMGKGIALQFKRAYPANYAAYRTACAAKEIKLGQMFLFDSARPGPGRYVINFPTKGHWRTSSKVADVQAGLLDLVRVVRAHGISSVAVPALGCGNGGLDWDEIRPLIERAFAALPDVRVLVFPPGSASDSSHSVANGSTTTERVT
ncbi:macro domain-containing protein [Micromonospora sp. NPDC023888]|uniref:macro domain-containing protein n=1 Tax=Micromonospora sp. NPDC023888 TaxID=3155607 RepID=UPI00340298D8